MLSRGQNGEKSKIRRKEFSTFKIVEIVENSLGKSAPMPETGDFGKNGQSVIHISHIAFCGKPPIRHFWAFFTKLPYFSKYRTAACSPRGRSCFVKCIRNHRILQISFCSPLPFSAPAVFLRFPFSAPLFSALFLFVLAVFLRGSLFPLAFFRFPFSLPLFSAPFPRRCFYRHSPTDGISVSAGTEEKQLSHRAIGQSGYGYIGQSCDWAYKVGTGPKSRDPRRVRGDRQSANTESKHRKQVHPSESKRKNGRGISDFPGRFPWHAKEYEMGLRLCFSGGIVPVGGLCGFFSGGRTLRMILIGDRRLRRFVSGDRGLRGILRDRAGGCPLLFGGGACPVGPGTRSGAFAAAFV